MDAKLIFGVLMVCACAYAQTIRQCQQLECPEFTVVQNTGAYELRRYTSSKWVSSQSIITNNWMQVKSRLFKNLFAYIKGANDRGVTIPMTAPVLTKVQPGPQIVMTMYFHIPSSFQLDTPTPTNSDVIVENIPQQDVYVRSFSGIARKENSMFNLNQLKTAIGDETLYDNSFVISASYDSPRARQNRHNELWLVKN